MLQKSLYHLRVRNKSKRLSSRPPSFSEYCPFRSPCVLRCQYRQSDRQLKMLGCLHRSKPLLVVEAATALIFVFWMLVSTSDCDENSFLSPILPCTSTPELRLDIAQASSKLPTAAICSTTLSTTSPPPHGEAARPLSPHELLCRSRSVNHTEVEVDMHLITAGLYRLKVVMGDESVVYRGVVVDR